MAWQQVYSVTRNDPLTDFVMEHVFESSLLIVRATPPPTYTVNWSIGRLYPIVDVAGVGTTNLRGRSVRLQTQFVEFSTLNLPFQLAFKFSLWIPTVTLTFWQPDPVSTASLDNLESLLIESLSNIALLQTSLDRLESKVDTPT